MNFETLFWDKKLQLKILFNKPGNWVAADQLSNSPVPQMLISREIK